jgi:hypothetical protein
LTAPTADRESGLLDFRLLLYLFVGFRLVLLLVYQPQLVESGGQVFDRGLTAYGDFAYHFGIARYGDSGLLPYRDFWYEYPPLIPILSGLVYRFSGPNFTAYANLLGLVLLAFDTGNLLLVRWIGIKLHGQATGEALAWLYALMIAPLVLIFWNFEAVVTFSALLAITWLLEKRDTGAALVIAFGALTKLVPLLLLGAAWRFRTASAALRQTIIAVAITGIGLIGVLAFGPKYGAPSLVAQLNKTSYQTVWALLDRNYTTGVFSNDRFDPAKAYMSQGNPALIPWWARTALFGAIGLAIFATTRQRDARGLVAFAAITVVIFYLWSPGWSTQWQALLVPLILLTWPTRRGALLVLALAVFGFAEYPLIFSRAADAQGRLIPAMLPIFSLTVLARTALLIGLGIMLYRQLREDDAEQN